ncbi:hypothetical protein ElyMa_003198600 [Elysia marginata]|uniref:Uncharacterized protein n=1 Tax=Elysia marginata TaxID=1093978 RepID=A0AAV4J1Q3_9GAST|nr:hypothetical protein ElyMa_003198600 [Elysia marginata]
MRLGSRWYSNNVGSTQTGCQVSQTSSEFCLVILDQARSTCQLQRSGSADQAAGNQWSGDESLAEQLLQPIALCGQETEDMKKQAVEATAHIKEAMLREHESNQSLQADIARLQVRINSRPIMD